MQVKIISSRLNFIFLIRYTLFLGLILFFNSSCAGNKHNDSTLINTSHLDFLYEKININSKAMGIIHIYSNYPDYKWIGDDDEGIACVDDAARAALFYMKYYKLTSNKNSFEKAENLVKFLLFMQADNGFYYNFIWPDHSINKTFKTSTAVPNWWSWRAILTLSKAYFFFKNENEALSAEILFSVSRAVDSTLKWMDKNFDDKGYVDYSGLKIPAWLPYETAADQSAILLEGLTDYYQIKKDPKVLKYIKILAEGIGGMQKGDSTEVPYSAFLSWQNTWHAWGNSQAASLLYAGKFFNKNDFISLGLKEVKYFYPFLIKENYLSAFKIDSAGNDNLIDPEKFPQIAYGIRPDVFACTRAFDITKDEKYLKTAVNLAGWLFGKNAAEAKMYNPSTGRCFDGIKDTSDVNRNSGAESTIEALLTLISLEENPVSKEMLFNYYRKMGNK